MNTAKPATEKEVEDENMQSKIHLAVFYAGLIFFRNHRFKHAFQIVGHKLFGNNFIV